MAQWWHNQQEGWWEQQWQWNDNQWQGGQWQDHSVDDRWNRHDGWYEQEDRHAGDRRSSNDWSTHQEPDERPWWEQEWNHSSWEPTTASQSKDNEESERDVTGGDRGGEDGSVEGISSTQSHDRKKITGKEVLPSFDGTTTLRDYRRRVALFLATTGIDEEFRAGRLMEKLEGRAWQATQTLDVTQLRKPGGVDFLLDHLQQELEPVEHLQIFNVLHGFFKSFRRNRGEEFTTFDTRFRDQVQKPQEIGAPLEGLVKSFWFLETSGISGDLRKQVVAAAGGSYQYERLRSALVALVPTVRKDEGETMRHQPSSNHKGKFGPRKIHGVNAVDEGDQEEAEHLHGDLERDDGDEEAQALEKEAQVLLTQAAKRRSQAEKARGFQRMESSSERDARVESMKSRLACNACRAHGVVAYGHWHADPECPYFEESQKKKKKKGENERGDRTKKVFTVQEGNNGGEEDESSDSEEAVYEVMMTWADYRGGHGIAMTDTCCAKTVVGDEWARHHMEVLRDAGVEFLVVRERNPFRFGPGRKVYSTGAFIFPLALPGGKGIAIVRASMVEGNIPLLLSKKALTELGGTLFLKQEKLGLSELETEVDLITTPADQVGVRIDAFDERHRRFRHGHLLDLLDGLDEIVIMVQKRTEGPKRLGGISRDESKTPQEPLSHPGKRMHRKKTTKHTAAVSSSKPAEREYQTDRPLDHEQDASTEAQGRLCGGDCRPMWSASRGAGQAYSGQVEGDMVCCSSTPPGEDPAGGMEEGKPRYSPRALCGVGGSGSQSEHRRSSLAWVEEKPILAGDRDLDAGPRGRKREERTRGGSPDTSLPGLQDSHDAPDQRPNRPRLLRLPAVPELQEDIEPHLRGPTNRGGSKGLGCKEQCEEGDQGRDRDGSWIWQKGSQAIDGAGKFYKRVMEFGRGDETRCSLGHGTKVPHEPDQGRDGCDPSETGGISSGGPPRSECRQ